MTSATAFPLAYELREASGMAEPSRAHLVQLLHLVFRNRLHAQCSNMCIMRAQNVSAMCALTCLACPTCAVTAARAETTCHCLHQQGPREHMQ